MLLLLLACGAPPATPMSPCPSSPNCVSSLADPADTRHHVAPLATTLAAAKAAAERVDGFDTWVVGDGDTLHATYVTPLMRYVDDLELQAADGVVHVRSASRVGYGDRGVNRARVEALRAALTSQPD